jgi:glycerophosphoryl diester phosphodiesterase
VPPHPYLDGPYPRAYAHRGWHLDELAGCENTMAAFRRAVAEGFEYLELDVHTTRDRVPIVHHDPFLDRTTDGTGLIATRSAAELSAVRVRGREPLPRLEQVLRELPSARITIELKTGSAVQPVLELLEETGSWERVCLGSFHDGWLNRARTSAGPRLCTSLGQSSAFGLRSRAWLDALPWPGPRLPTPPVIGDLAQLPHRFGRLTVVDATLLRTARASGREVHVWTINAPAQMAQLLDLGVDGLLSDRPDLLREQLAARGCWSR